jgi:hypothetical protein
VTSTSLGDGPNRLNYLFEIFCDKVLHQTIPIYLLTEPQREIETKQEDDQNIQICKMPSKDFLLQ